MNKFQVINDKTNFSKMTSLFSDINSVLVESVAERLLITGGKNEK